MRAGCRTSCCFIIAAAFGIVGCTRPLKRTVDAREAGTTFPPDPRANDDAGISVADGAADPGERNPFDAVVAGDAAVVSDDGAQEGPLSDPDGADLDTREPSEASGPDGGFQSPDVSARGDAHDAADANLETPACKESFMRSALAPSSIRAGSWARMVAAADLDGDGNLDIATANPAGNTVSVLLGNGDGTFERNVDYACGKQPEALAIGDLNGDNRPDIVTANFEEGTVSVLLGRGTGTFARRVVYATGGAPRSVALGDVTGDGTPDIVTANVDPDTMSFLPGLGDGTFGANVDYVMGVDPSVVALGDLNGDGMLDVATATHYAVSVLYGSTDGQLGKRQDLELQDGRPLSLGLADLNADGRLEIVTTDVASVKVFLASDDGSLAAYSDHASVSPSLALAFGDVDGDGNRDVVVAKGDLAALGIFPGAGDGTLGDPQSVRTGPEVLPDSVALGDFNGDGLLDIVTTTGSEVVELLLARGDGTFGGWSEHGTGTGPAAAVLADMNGDGKLDLVTANRLGASVTVLLGRGDGRLADGPVSLTGAGPSALVVTDVNGDDKPDVVTANHDAATVSVLLGTGDGNLAAALDLRTDSPPASLALADFDADGKVDLVVGTVENWPGAVSVYMGMGDGTFGAKHDVYSELGRDALSLATGDLNGDGRVDLVLGIDGHDGGAPLKVLLGAGDGTFTFGADDQVGYGSPLLALADLDEDGRLDLVEAIRYESSVSVRHGLGDGTFTALQTLEINADLVAMTSGDIDRDGNVDLAAATTTGSVLLLHGKGDGTFGAASAYAVESDLSSLALGDLNGDGMPDIVTVSTGRNTWAALLSSCR